ncbi:MAG: carbon monoxide dehydrogenase subunit G [Acidobacteria bacterium]|nr:carbon monoxide dehydrogenase subunit G [Acidobacteriota bacterium]MBI3281672.1 carbon monoxide dehydrogenase subunit G [Acidobacteriota bacterium]
MKISGAYRLSLPQERAYALLQDPAMLAHCMPGAERLDKVGEDEYQMKLRMSIASISGNFDGRVRVADKNPHQSFRLVVEGTGKIGFVRGDGLLRIAAEDSGSNVTYEGDVQVGGTIAAVGQRLLDVTSKMMIKRFFDKFAEAAASA